MPIFGDESGDPGMKQDSSPTFSLAFVLFENQEKAEACNQMIADLKIRLAVQEFHWIDLNRNHRMEFLAAVKCHDFHYIIQTLDKSKLSHRDFRRTAFFYERVAEKMARGIEEYLRIIQECCWPMPINKRVVLDRNGDPVYVRAMKKYLHEMKDATGRSLIGRITTRRSISDNLIQLADMVCGLHAKIAKEAIANKIWTPHLTWP